LSGDGYYLFVDHATVVPPVVGSEVKRETEQVFATATGSDDRPRVPCKLI